MDLSSTPPIHLNVVLSHTGEGLLLNIQAQMGG